MSIVAQAMNDGDKTKKMIKRQILNSKNVNVSQTTVREVLKARGISSHVKLPKPNLSRMNKLARIGYAKVILESPMEYRNHIIYSDESRCEMLNSRR